MTPPANKTVKVWCILSSAHYVYQPLPYTHFFFSSFFHVCTVNTERLQVTRTHIHIHSRTLTVDEERMHTHTHTKTWTRSYARGKWTMTQECNESSELNLFDDMSYTVKVTTRISLNSFTQMKLDKSIDSTWILSFCCQMEWNGWTNINSRPSKFGTNIWLCLMRPISPQCWISFRVFWQIASAMQGLTAKLCVREYERVRVCTNGKH